MKLGLLSSTVVFLAFFYFFVSVLAEEKKSALKNSFLIFTGLYSLILITEILLRLPFMKAYHQPIMLLSYAFFMCTGIAFLNFTYAILGRTRDTLFAFFAGVAVLGVVIAFTPNSLLVEYRGDQLLAMPSKITSLFVLIALIIPSLLSIFFVYRFLRSTDSEEKRGLAKMLLMGTFLAVIFGVVIGFIIPFLFPKLIVVYQFSSLTAVVMGAFLYFSLKRFHFIHLDFEEIESVSQTLFNAVNEGVVVFGKSGELLQINSVAQTLLGPVENSGDIEELIPVFEPSKRILSCRSEIQAPERVIPILVSQSEIRKGAISLGYILIIHDIYELVRLEQDRERMKERIRQSEKLESIGQLAGGVAHDFNNQLTGIIGCAEFLMNDIGDKPEAKAMIEMILKSAQSSADLTGKLLAFARKGKYITKVIDMHEVINEVESLLKRTIDKRILLEIELTAESAKVRGDATQLQNALLNLAINACDAMAESGGVLSFYTDVVDGETLHHTEGCDTEDELDYLSISVADSGTGMTEEVRKRIFEPFFTTKEQGKGTGMGLSAVYGTVINHHGSIVVNSILGEGTSFNILLPLVDNTHSDHVSHEDDFSFEKGEGELLLIDDEELILKIGKGILERSGYSVTTCNNGLDALEMVKEDPQRFTLVILDLVMPELRGDEVHMHLRKYNAHLPILISSGYSEDGVAHDLLGDGATNFIQKPFHKESLLRAIHILLKKCQKENSPS